MFGCKTLARFNRSPEWRPASLFLGVYDFRIPGALTVDCDLSRLRGRAVRLNASGLSWGVLFCVVNCTTDG